MAKFRKKPVEIEAMVFPGLPQMAAPDFRDQCRYMEKLDAWLAAANDGTDRKCRFVGNTIKIATLESDGDDRMTASPGDWIIKGVSGEIYPCKPHIFEATYELVE